MCAYTTVRHGVVKTNRMTRVCKRTSFFGRVYSQQMNSLPIMCLAAASSYPCTYTGTRLGVTATVVRLDDARADLTLRAGPIPIARGTALVNSDGELVLDKKITRTLRARGVSIVDVTPRDDVIKVRARVPLVGEIPVDLLRVRTSRT